MRSDRDSNEVSAWWDPKKDIESSFELVKSSWLNVLLLAAPLGIASHMLNWDATTVFMLVGHGSCSRQSLIAEGHRRQLWQSASLSHYGPAAMKQGS
jgi:hypothetical protein